MLSLQYKMNAQIFPVFKWDLAPLPPAVLNSAIKIGRKTGRLPQQYPHVGVAVEHKFYQFGLDGLKSNFELPVGYKCHATLSTTTKNSAEIEDWFFMQRVKYRSELYNLATHNCISFCRDMCEFLQVEFDPDLLTLLEWLEKNEMWVKRIQDKILTSPILRTTFGSALAISGSFSSEIPQSKAVFDAMKEIFMPN